MPVKLTGKLADGTIFTKKGDDEKPFEFKTDEGILTLVMFLNMEGFRSLLWFY